MKQFAKKLIKKYKKDFNLSLWDVDLELSNKIRTQILFDDTTKQALIIINTIKVKTFSQLTIAIKHEMTHLKYPDKNEEEIIKLTNEKT